jgi:predicted permease
MLLDLRYALRGLARNPLFALSAIAAIAIGIGASAAVFSVVDRILFRPLPYASENSLVSVGMMAPLDTNEFMFASEYFDLRRNPGPFAAVTSFQAGALAVDVTEQNPVRLQALRVEANFLDTLGIRLFHGRGFTAAQDRPNGPRVALLSYGVWRSRFAADPRALGRTLTIDGAPTVIAGVLPPDFETPTPAHADLLLPEALDEARERQGRALRVFARLKPGVTPRQALAQLGPHLARAMETVPPRFRKEVSLRVRPIRDRQTGDARRASEALFGAVLAVLLIACANVANLLLARAVGREREMAVRTALGASRARLIRQALTESLLLALAGGAAGCALAALLLRSFVAIAPGGLPHLDQAAIDPRVLWFAVGLSLASGLLFGLAPALRRPPGVPLAGARFTGPSGGGLRSLLVAAQIGASVVLLTAAGLLLRSLWNLEKLPTGIQPDHVITARFTLGSHRYQRESDQIAFFNELERRLALVPGAESVAIGDSIPPSGATRFRLLAAVWIEGAPPRPEGTGGTVTWRYVSPGYFGALGIPIVRGRGFTGEDRAPNRYAVVVSQTLARRLFPDGDALGRRILRDPDGEWFTIVGIAADVKNNPSLRPDPEYYLLRKSVPDLVFHRPEPPTGWRAAAAVVRTSLDPRLVATALRQVVASIDGTLPVEIETMRRRIEDTHARPRFDAFLLAFFAAIALALAALGIFGVMSFLVAQRTREFGVRMALGATPAAILRAALAQAARWVAGGLVLGAAGSAAATVWLRSMLFQVAPFDPATVAMALAALAAVALLAAAGPARRAARLNPMATLREE